MGCYADQGYTHPQRVGHDFHHICSCEKLIVLLHVIKVVGAWEVCAARELDGQLGVVENIKDDGTLACTDTRNLTAFVHAMIPLMA